MSGRQRQHEQILRYLKLLAVLLLAVLALWYKAPAVMAEDGDTGTEQT